VEEEAEGRLSPFFHGEKGSAPVTFPEKKKKEKTVKDWILDHLAVGGLPWKECCGRRLPFSWARWKNREKSVIPAPAKGEEKGKGENCTHHRQKETNAQPQQGGVSVRESALIGLRKVPLASAPLQRKGADISLLPKEPVA